MTGIMSNRKRLLSWAGVAVIFGVIAYLIQASLSTIFVAFMLLVPLPLWINSLDMGKGAKFALYVVIIVLVAVAMTYLFLIHNVVSLPTAD